MSNTITQTKPSTWQKVCIASFINLFEHYDKALFAFLAPFFARLFFNADTTSLTKGLIYTYALLPIGLLSKPIGALIFGRISNRYGRLHVLKITWIGMAITTTLMGFLPTYQQIGIAAPLLLSCAKLSHDFFISGANTGGSLLILESCKHKDRGFFNGLYESSTILGVICASIAVGTLSHYSLVESHWRILYWIGGCIGIISMKIRSYPDKPVLPYPAQSLKTPFPIKTYWSSLVIIVFTSGLSYANYYMITSFLNGYIPIISSISSTTMIHTTTYLLVLDLLLLPLIGRLSSYYNYQYLILIFGILIALFAIPLYNQLIIPSLPVIIIIRIIFTILGIGFSVFLNLLYQDLIPFEYRYQLIALGKAIGSQLFGTSACSIGFILYAHTKWAGAPALYLTMISTITIAVLAKYLNIQQSKLLKHQ